MDKLQLIRSVEREFGIDYQDIINEDENIKEKQPLDLGSKYKSILETLESFYKYLPTSKLIEIEGFKNNFESESGCKYFKWMKRFVDSMNQYVNIFIENSESIFVKYLINKDYELIYEKNSQKISKIYYFYDSKGDTKIKISFNISLYYKKHKICIIERIYLVTDVGTDKIHFRSSDDKINILYDNFIKSGCDEEFLTSIQKDNEVKFINDELKVKIQ